MRPEKMYGFDPSEKPLDRLAPGGGFTSIFRSIGCVGDSLSSGEFESMSPDEICAVFAHEMGHGLHKDTLRNQLFSFLQMAVLGVLAWLTLRSTELFIPFGFGEVNYGFAMIIIMSVEFALIAPLFGLLISYFSRRAEYRADAQAVKEGYGAELISALKKLARRNFSELAPSPLLVKLEYSHPTLSQRITAIEKLENEIG